MLSISICNDKYPQLHFDFLLKVILTKPVIIQKINVCNF